jgi:hypothetical protein
MLRAHGLPHGDAQRRIAERAGALEPLLELLGAREVLALDASDYESADFVHDLNEPIPDTLRGRFTTVFDGGTIEHVFDVAAVLRNYLAMVEVGGRLIIHTMANNYLGHGFYQFSPEFFYRVLTPENGYEIERVVLAEDDLRWRGALGVRVPVEVEGGWYEVADPAAVGGRVELANRRPVVIQVQARRVADVPPFARAPQQSDYVVEWTRRPDEPAARAGGPLPRLASAARRRIPLERRARLAFDLLPRSLRLLDPVLGRREATVRSFRNGRAYRRVR